ncbi:hypothetical protein C8R44DRAFT_775589, partial [Mycena epipterygia]
LWPEMVTLGLYDAPLWDALDLAWEVVLGALNLAAAQPRTPILQRECSPSKVYSSPRA